MNTKIFHWLIFISLLTISRLNACPDIKLPSPYYLTTNYIGMTYFNNIDNLHFIKFRFGYQNHEDMYESIFGDGGPKEEYYWNNGINFLTFFPMIEYNNKNKKTRINIGFNLASIKEYDLNINNNNLNMMKINLLNFEPFEIYKNKIDWINLMYGVGYNLLPNKAKNMTAPIIYANLNIMTLNPLSADATELNKFINKNYTGLNMNLGLMLLLNFKFLDVRLSSDYGFLTSRDKIRILENRLSVNLINYFTFTRHDCVDCFLTLTRYFHKNELNLLLKNNVTSINDSKQTINYFGLEYVHYFYGLDN
jgi:hypothetical protein